MVKVITKGRQKVEIKRINEESKRQVTFSKRKLGLFNKAAELNILTGAEVVAIVFSQHQKIYSFVSPGSDYLIKSYRNWGTAPSNDIINYAPQEHIDHHGLGHGYHNLEAEVNFLEEKNKLVLKNRIDMEANGEREGFWWNHPHENMDFEEAKRFRDALLGFNEMVEKKVKEMTMMTKQPAKNYFPSSNEGESEACFGQPWARGGNNPTFVHGDMSGVKCFLP
ncbi:MADS-box transcription factor [Parasponia andersonii]|uniref:MADS-box transcription factor n=1 Tax=Parasponia andersonii TaxID=3476 RepID=A0A2P5BPG6_PARAD|nr:MADS-box transcription factor [Parasponia andersonii]